MPGQTRQPDLAQLYQGTCDRVIGLVWNLGEDGLAAPVPACPKWRARDVLAHLAAVAGDALAGRLTGPPTEEETAAQVARFASRDVAGILAAWQHLAPRFAQVVGELRVWPAVIDVASHEQDIRAALGLPGARDTDTVWWCADWLLSRLRLTVPLRVSVEDGEFRLGPDAPAGEAVLGLTTTRFEAFRWRMGRRSRAQLAALDWSGDPSPVLDHLVVFGPAGADITE
jgi:uncharacterized protein (TIGR03083 family)